MKVVLIDSEDIPVRKDEEKEKWLLINLEKSAFQTPGEVQQRTQDEDSNERDKIKEQLLSEILTDDCDLGFVAGLFLHRKKLWKKQMEVYIGSPNYIGDCVMTRLWNRFRNQAKISVYVKYSSDAVTLAFEEFIFEDLEIKEGIAMYFCSDYVNTKRTSWDDAPSVRVRVTVDVPDHLVLTAFAFPKKILDEGLFCDVTITAGNGAKIQCHKSFLSVCSPVLKAMFQSGMKESKEDLVNMTDISEEGVRAFLAYIYCGDLEKPKEDMDVTFDLLYVSDKYDVPSLEAEMVACLSKRKNEDFSVELAFKLYMFTRNMKSAVEVKEKAVQILKGNLGDMLSLQECKDVFEKTPEVAADIFNDFVNPNLTKREKKPVHHNFARKVLEEESYFDVTISTGNGAVVQCHKSFLSACSPVLRSMFASDTKESYENVVDMSDISEAGVKAFLRFVYYGDLEMPKENIQVAFDLLCASHKYAIPSLKEKMITCLMERKNEDFSVKLAFKLYMFARNMESAVELKGKTVETLKGKLTELKSLQEYKDVYEKAPKLAMEVFKDFVNPSANYRPRKRYASPVSYRCCVI